ncbi:MMPL family transporter [Labedaea rhizosphaerae]|uniref:MMPL family transporter n=1 Tax=Labedaea rhizosphaerae TaxID=598644 RepID=UPI00105EA450|nr:MMPL family transporter [Labedaea rhizosphaerae]
MSALVLAITVGGGLWGLGVFDKLTQGGWDDPKSESALVNTIVQNELGQRSDIAIRYTAPDGTTIDDPAVAGPVEAALYRLPADAVARVTSYWDTRAPQLHAGDKYALATITLAGNGYDERQAAYGRIADQLRVPGIQTEIGGQLPTEHSLSEQSNSDLAVAESISIPVTLILLVLIFGSVVAAALPVLVGGLSIFGALGVLHLLTQFLEVNNFALNVASLLGLGLAIDYGLFSVGRFREELAKGADTASAVRTTVATAGRTVAFSATLLVLALSGLLVFPMDFLRSMAYGGMAAVAIAALVSLTLLPAVLGILGHRVDKFAVPWRRAEREPRLLGKLAGAVMRRPIAFVLPIVAGLVLLAVPFTSASFGAADEKQLPPGASARVAAESISETFPQFSNRAVRIVLRGEVTDPAPFIAAADAVDGIGPVHPVAQRGEYTVFGADVESDAMSDHAKTAVRDLRQVAPPAGTTMLVGGFSAQVVDSVDAITDRVPDMIAILVAATLLLMFLAFGSVLLPIKAVVMSLLSLSATFGVLVWVFQYGHGAGLLDVTPQPVQAGMIVLIGAIVFGLSTDYETFLLSRMVEAREAGMSTKDAIRTGLVRTGRMISAAALLLAVVTGAFGMSSLATMRFIGVGMVVALLLDATVVRMMLVPAVLRLFGDAAWWAPKRLRRWQQRSGFGERSELPEREPELV